MYLLIGVFLAGAFESLICLDMRYQTISIRNGSRQGKGGEINL